MDSAQINKLWIALGVSVGVHLFVAVIAEVGSSGGPNKKTEAPPVEISRVALDGTSLPSGKGNAAFNSPASVSSPGADGYVSPLQSLEAGVPMKIKLPPPTASQFPDSPTSSDSRQQPPPRSETPSSSIPENQTPSSPTTNQEPNRTSPPRPSDSQPASQPSRPSTAGNQGQVRSRGPNRAALPTFTVEPAVPQSLMTSGVTSWVEVTVQVAASGTHTESIDKSSGSAEVDRLVLDALRQWVWDPAARNGETIDSSQSFQFKFKAR